MHDRNLSLILPCYNEEKILKDNVRQIIEILDSFRFTYEIIFVDDLSQDRTRDIIDEIIREYPHREFKKIFHEKNTGRGGAVRNGIKKADGEVVGFVDVDLEIHARYIPSFVLAIKNGYDMAMASRVYKFKIRSIKRYMMSKGYIFLVRHILGLKMQDTEAGFKFFDRNKILPILDETKEDGWFWDTEIVARAYLNGFRIKEIPCVYVKNFKKVSTVKDMRDSIYYINALARFRKIFKNKMEKFVIDKYWKEAPQICARIVEKHKNVFLQSFLDKRHKHMARLLDNLTLGGMEAVDVGCGGGIFLETLLKKGARVTGVDYSDVMLKACRKNLKCVNDANLMLVNCDASSLELPDGKFDLLLSIGLLDYVDNVEEVLNEFKRVMKPNAGMIATIPRSTSLFFSIRNEFGRYIKKVFLKLPPIKNSMSKGQAKRVFLKNGFLIRKIESLYFGLVWVIQAEKI